MMNPAKSEVEGSSTLSPQTTADPKIDKGAQPDTVSIQIPGKSLANTGFPSHLDLNHYCLTFLGIQGEGCESINAVMLTAGDAATHHESIPVSSQIEVEAQAPGQENASQRVFIPCCHRNFDPDTA
jgi:hypothetical protein